jgi:glycosyltransferase involved in cell wall biosynthesis
MSFNQGSAGSGMMGAASLDTALLAGLGRRSDVDLDFVGPPRSTVVEKLVARPYPPLSHIDLDFHPVRWHQVESWKARRSIERAINEGGRPDALLVNSHAVSFRLGSLMTQIPTLLHVDTLAWPWAEMGIWRRVRHHSRWTLRPSIRAEARSLRSAAGVLAWSGWAERQVAELEPAARVFRWHPGIDTARYRPAPRRDADRPKVLFIGGRFEQKGGPDLVAALGPLLGSEIELHIVTPSETPTGPGIVVHRLGSSDPELLDLIQQASVVCLPSRGDATPWVVLEAMACGTPVVATDVGAIPEMLDFGASGLVVPAMDVSGLRTAVTAVLHDASLATRLADSALATVHSRFDARRQGARLVSLLDDVTQASSDDALRGSDPDGPR